MYYLHNQPKVTVYTLWRGLKIFIAGISTLSTAIPFAVKLVFLCPVIAK